MNSNLRYDTLRSIQCPFMYCTICCHKNFKHKNHTKSESDDRIFSWINLIMFLCSPKVPEILNYSLKYLLLQSFLLLDIKRNFLDFVAKCYKSFNNHELIALPAVTLKFNSILSLSLRKWIKSQYAARRVLKIILNIKHMCVDFM